MALRVVAEARAKRLQLRKCVLEKTPVAVEEEHRRHSDALEHLRARHVLPVGVVPAGGECELAPLRKRRNGNLRRFRLRGARELRRHDFGTRRRKARGKCVGGKESCECSRYQSLHFFIPPNIVYNYSRKSQTPEPTSNKRQSPLHDGERVGLHANDAGAV